MNKQYVFTEDEYNKMKDRMIDIFYICEKFGPSYELGEIERKGEDIKRILKYAET